MPLPDEPGADERFSGLFFHLGSISKLEAPSLQHNI